MKNLYSYERDEHVAYLESIKKEGRYDDFVKEVESLRTLTKNLRLNERNPFKVIVVTDQAEGVYWGDIMFTLDKKPKTQTDFDFKAGQVCGLLGSAGMLVGPDSLYYNTITNGFMCTAVAIKCDKGPELFSEEVRLNRNAFLMR